jgi:hypothetical protein
VLYASLPRVLFVNANERPAPAAWGGEDSRYLSVNRFRYCIAASVVASLAACGTVMTTAHSGFLTDYRALANAPGTAGASRPSVNLIDPARVSVEAVVWRVTSSADFSRDERENLLARLQTELQQRVQALPPQPQGCPAVLRAAITQVETVSPALNVLSAVLLTVPLDRGGAAVEIEAVDAQTGRQLAALTQGYFAPISELRARFEKMASADLAVRKAAADFVQLLQPAENAARDTALPDSALAAVTRRP